MTFRRLLVILARRAFLILLLVCLGCSAQSAPSDIVRLIQRQVRAFYSVPPEVKLVVGPLRPSEFPDYDAVTITFDNAGKKQDHEFLLSKDHRALLRVTKLDLTKDQYAETMKKIDVVGRPTRGSKDAKVVAINYDDFQCPFCSRMHETLFPALFSEYGDRVLFIYKDYPLVEMHPWATHAAVDANCLGAQNSDAYWEYADYLHGNQEEIKKEKGFTAQIAALDKIATLQGQKHSLDTAKLASCIKAQDDKAVKASAHEGDTLGVDATPTMFVNGEKVSGAVPIEQLRAIFDRALQDAGVAIPLHKPATGEANSPPAKPST